MFFCLAKIKKKCLLFGSKNDFKLFDESEYRQRNQAHKKKT